MGNLPDLKELDKLIALCRKRGITEIEFNGLRLTLGELKAKATRRSRSTSKSNDVGSQSQTDAPIESDSPTHDELLYWSSGMPTE